MCPLNEEWLEYETFRFPHSVSWHPSPEFAPTIFVGGAFMTMESWVRFARAFVPHTTVILVDPPGIGRSDYLPAEHPPEFLAHALARVIEAHALERVNVVAFSYGTVAAFRLAQLYPHYLNRVVLGGTTKQFSERVVEGVPVIEQVRSSIGMALGDDREFFAQEIVRGLVNRRDPLADTERQALAARVVRSNIMQMSDEELRAYAANTERLLIHGCADPSIRVRGPKALVFTGEHDDFTRPIECKEIAAGFDDAIFTTIRRADHVFNIEQYEPVLDLLFWFLRGEVGAPPATCGPIEVISAPEGALIGGGVALRD